MRVELQPAYVLHRRPYQESSFLLELLTRDHGRIGAVGRGASKRGALLQPFQALLVSWRQRNSELVSLGGIERDAAATPIQLGPRALPCGLYVNEVTQAMLARNDACPRLFQAYTECLGKLGVGQQLDWCLRRFEVELLSELGYGLLLEEVGDTGEPLDPSTHYRFEPDRGPQLAAVGESAWHVDGATLLALGGNEAMISRSTRQQAKRLMQAVLNHYLEGRPLRSRELLNPNWTR